MRSSPSLCAPARPARHAPGDDPRSGGGRGPRRAEHRVPQGTRPHRGHGHRRARTVRHHVDLGAVIGIRLRRRHHLLPDRHQPGHFRRGRHLARLHRALVQHQLARAADRLARLRGHRHRDQLAASTSQPAAATSSSRRWTTWSRAARCAPASTPPGSPSPGTRWAAAARLEAASDRPSLQAAVPLAPWNTDKTWSGVRVPTLIIGGESDTVAPVASHSVPFYKSIPARRRRRTSSSTAPSHFFPQTVNTLTGQVRGRLAQALRRQRHPLRAVPLPGPARPDDRGVPRHLPGLVMIGTLSFGEVVGGHPPLDRPRGREPRLHAGADTENMSPHGSALNRQPARRRGCSRTAACPSAHRPHHR